MIQSADAWLRAGAELRRRDPIRYAAVLKLVEEMCSIFRDPLDAELADARFYFLNKDPDLLD